MKVNKQSRGVIGATMGALIVAVILASVAAAMPAHAAVRSKAQQTAGAKTNFNFINIPVRSALQMIAEHGGFNLVVSDSVQGTITLHLDDVTWEEALDVVMRLKGLQMRVDSGMLSVTPKGG
jgi:type II secretory pathway component HofQ